MTDRGAELFLSNKDAEPEIAATPSAHIITIVRDSSGQRALALLLAMAVLSVVAMMGRLGPRHVSAVGQGQASSLGLAHEAGFLGAEATLHGRYRPQQGAMVLGGPVQSSSRSAQTDPFAYAFFLPLVAHSGPTTYHVSKTGTNGDGRSWATAWSELDQINWSVIQPGDTILIDGGPTSCAFPATVTGESNTPRSASGGDCGMVYQSTLTVGKSGDPGNPITIKVAEEPGRDGTVRIFGGRSTPLPYCGQTGYVWQTEGVRQAGIYMGGCAHVVIDGVKWSGVMIYGHNRHGIWMKNNPQDITVRNVEVFDNGVVYNGGPDQPGINPVGTGLHFDRVIVHDNGQDAFQTAGVIANFTLTRSWLYNRRQNPTKEGESFNYCRHPDGIQIFNGGSQSGLTVEESIIGPGFMQGVILGQRLTSGGAEAVVHNATFRDVLFTKARSTDVMGYPQTKPSGWVLDHVTVHHPETSGHCLHLDGSGHTIKDSIFHSGRISLPDGVASASGNWQWNTRGFQVGLVADPLFAQVDGQDPFSLDDYSLLPDSPCAGKGSRLTSVAQLLALHDGVSAGLTYEVDTDTSTSLLPPVRPSPPSVTSVGTSY